MQMTELTLYRSAWEKGRIFVWAPDTNRYGEVLEGPSGKITTLWSDDLPVSVRNSLKTDPDLDIAEYGSFVYFKRRVNGEVFYTVGSRDKRVDTSRVPQEVLKELQMRPSQRAYLERLQDYIEKLLELKSQNKRPTLREIVGNQEIEEPTISH